MKLKLNLHFLHTLSKMQTAYLNIHESYNEGSLFDLLTLFITNGKKQQ